jgi:hypothetical protein
LSTAAARAGQADSTAPEITLKDCAFKSRRHSLFRNPRGVSVVEIGAPVSIAVPRLLERLL